MPKKNLATKGKENKELNPRQHLFCQYYTSDELLGNGVKSYCKAYNIDASDLKKYSEARFKASHLLENSNISQHINNLLDAAGLNDNFADKRLLYLMSQNDDKGTALGALREYNKLKQRITDKIDMKVNGSFEISLKLE